MIVYDISLEGEITEHRVHPFTWRIICCPHPMLGIDAVSYNIFQGMPFDNAIKLQTGPVLINTGVAGGSIPGG